MFGKKKNTKSVTFEKSDVAKRHNLRISTPNGYFPEDVDRVLLSLENQINLLTKESSQLSEKLDTAIRDKEAADNQIRSLTMQLQTMQLSMTTLEIPETSLEQDAIMLNRMATITDEPPSPKEEMKLPPIIGGKKPENTDYLKSLVSALPKETKPIEDEEDEDEDIKVISPVVKDGELRIIK